MQIDLDTNQVDHGVAFVRAQLSLTVEKKISRRGYHCDDSTTMLNYTKCLLDEIENQYPCSAIMEKVGQEWNASKICNSSLDFYKSQMFMKHKMKEALDNDSASKCVKPCQKLSYEAGLIRMNKNTNLISPFTFQMPGLFSFGMTFEEYKINYKEEYLVMGLTELLASIGGFLGLCLGYSIITIGEWVSIFAKKCLKYQT